MCDDQSGFIQCCDDIGHGEGFAGAGDTQKGLELVAFLKAFHQFCNRLGLVTGGLILAVKYKMIHNCSQCVMRMFFYVYTLQILIASI